MPITSVAASAAGGCWSASTRRWSPKASPRRHRLTICWTHLAPDRRDAFVLTQLVGLPYEEAAAVLGCPIGTVRSRVARARAELYDAAGNADAL